MDSAPINPTDAVNHGDRTNSNDSRMTIGLSATNPKREHGPSRSPARRVILTSSTKNHHSFLVSRFRRSPNRSPPLPLRPPPRGPRRRPHRRRPPPRPPPAGRGTPRAAAARGGGCARGGCC
uniref:Uncharacterized protein n=1 Tax=Arundo donax TaxID=35708 RepID=A0A0A9F4F1_ARUDO